MTSLNFFFNLNLCLCIGGWIIIGMLTGYFAWSVYEKNYLTQRGFWFKFFWPMKILNGCNQTEWIILFKSRNVYMFTMAVVWPLKLSLIFIILCSVVVTYAVLFVMMVIYFIVINIKSCGKYLTQLITGKEKKLMET